MKNSFKTLASWALVAITLLLGVVQPVSANLPAQTAGTVIESLPERPLYGPEAVLAPQFDPGFGSTVDSGGQVQWNNVPWSEMVYQSLDPNTYNDWDLWMTESNSGLTYQLMNTPYNEVQPRLNWPAGQVVYVQVNGSSYDIYRYNLQTRGNTRLTYTDAQELNPDWSPDGTKIVYESYQDGQAEIYVMNADGSASTRLTNNAGGADYDYDGMPSWSPDGTKIAFVSKRTGGYRIWVMNTDGTNPYMLTTQPYSSHPVWKPDGTALMFSCDQNGDGFWDAWHVNTATFAEYSIRTKYQVDYWPNTYSPNGAYQALTMVNYVYYNDAWYWTSAMVIDPQSGNLLPGDLIWSADWASYDLTPPVASLAALPEISPAPPAIIPYVYDGQSGIHHYDVQIQKEGTQTWENITVDYDWYPYEGGARYYFRIQAYDQGGNVDPNPNYDAVTTVEWFPPISQIIPLPEYSKGSTVVLKLASHDVGGSPISGHEVQVYDHEIGEWTTLHDSVTEQIEFEGEIGHTYSFRSAATDRANNIEDWPTAPYGDTTTTLYERAITGHVYTNTGLPVTSAEVITNPPPINDPSSDQSGFYAGYLGGDSNPLTAFWTKDGYGSVPTTSYAGSQDVMVDAYLPPADNVVVNWDFEENPDTLANWMTGGLYVPSPNLDRYHTGIISATVGLTAGLGTPAPAACFNPLASATTPDGVFHVICEGMFHLSYDHGQWSAPTQISSDTPLRQNLSLLVGEDNSLHIFWKRTTPSATEQYIKRDPAGAWSAIMTLYTVYSDSIQAFAIDATGGVHVVYGRSSQNTINYAHCWPNGTWDSPTTYAIPIEYKISYLALTTDPLNQPIVFYWTNANSDLGFLSIIQKQSGGSWQNLLSNFSTETPQSAVVVTTLADEEMAAVWISKNSTWITRRDLAGTWSTPIAAGPSTGLRRPRLQIAQGIDNKLYMFSQYIDWPARYFTSISFIDLDTNQRSESYLEVNRCEVTADQQGRLHVAYNFTNSNHLYYRYQDDAGNWYDELIKSAAGDIYPYVHDIAIDESGQPQFIYQEGANVIHQTRLIYAPQSGSSLLKQTVLVPAGDPYLSFMYATNGLGSPNVQLKVSVMQSGETTEVFATSPDIPFKWKHAVIDLSPWAGHSVTLGFSATQTLGQLRTAYFIDEVSIGTGYTDIWVHGAAGEARPGETLAVQIHYGNRSMVAAGASSLTLTLPAGLSLLEANPPADEPGGTTWTIGTIPAYANGLITLNLEVAPEVPLFTALVGDVSLTTGAELETANNHGQLLVRVGNYLFLPLVER